MPPLSTIPSGLDTYKKFVETYLQKNSLRETEKKGSRFYYLNDGSNVKTFLNPKGSIMEIEMNDESKHYQKIKNLAEGEKK